MTTNINALHIRRKLGHTSWKPPKPHGNEWVHASFAHSCSMPTYDDLKFLHRVVFGDGWAYQVFAAPTDHVNIHEHALHLWGRLDGKPVLPDFTHGMGSV